MFLKRFSFSSDSFYFDAKKFNNIKDPEEKINSLVSNLKGFVTHYENFPITQKDKDRNKDIIELYNIMCNMQSDIIDSNLDLILASIPYFCQIITDLEGADRLSEIIDKSIDLMQDAGTKKQLAKEALRNIFQKQSICDYFIDEKLSFITQKFIVSQTFPELIEIFDLFKTEAFYSALALTSASATIFLPVNFILGFRESGEIDIPNYAFTQLISSIFNICTNTFGVDVFEEFKGEKILERTKNSCFNLEAKDILDIFESVATVDDNFPVHPTVLNIINEIYVSKKEMQKEFLIYINNKLKAKEYNITTDYVDTLSLHKWFVPEICSDPELFTAYSELTKGIAAIKDKAITPIISPMFDFLVAPIGERVLLIEIIDFFIELVDKGLTNVTMGDYAFLKKVIIEPPLEGVTKLFLECDELRALFRILFSEKRIGWHPHDLMKRILDCAEMCETIHLTDYFCEIIKENFNPGILRFLIENIDNSKANEIIYQALSPWRSDIVTMFKTADCFSVVESKAGCKQWTIMFLTFINTIVIHENNHFFDDWLIRQPKESPFFQLDNNEIKEIVIPARSTDPIPIPSLVPLCEDFETQSNYNLYLLGAYAIPIYTKLGVKLDTVANVKLITNRFVRLADFEALLDTNVHFVSELIMQPIDDFPIFEFFPSHGPGYIEPEESVSCLGFALKVRFDEKPMMDYHFLSFNEYSVGINDNKLLAPDGSEVATIEYGKWIVFLVYWNKSTQTIDFFMNGESIFSLPSDKQVVFNLIGNMNEPAPSFSVANTFSLINTQLTESGIEHYKLPKIPSLELTPKMSCGLALYNTFSTIYSDNAQILRLFKRFEKTESGKEDYLRIIAQIPDTCKINVKLFFRTFLHSLNDLAKDCCTGWCTEFALAILWMSDIKMKTKIYISVIEDFEFWNAIPVSCLLEFVDCTRKYLDNHTDDFDYTKFINANGLIQLFYLIFSVSSRTLSDSLIGLYCFFLQHAGSQSIKQTEILAKSANMWKFHDQNAEQNELEPFLLDFAQESVQQSHFCTALLDLESTSNIQVFSTESLFFLACITTPEAAIKIISCALSRQPDNAFMEENMALICTVVQRFPLEVELWNFFFSRLCDMQINIQEFDETEKYAVKKPIYIAPIFAMISTLFKNEPTEIFHQITKMFNSVFIPQLSLLTNQKLSQLIHLICGGKREIPDCEIEEFSVPELIKITKNEQIELKANFPETTSKWKDHIGNLIKEVSLKNPLPSDFVNFVSYFLSKMIHEQSDDIITKSPRGIYIIARYADPEIKKEFFMKYIGDPTKSSKKVLTAVADSLCYLFDENREIFEDELIFHCIIKFCIENPKMQSIFTQFVIKALPIIKKIDMAEFMQIAELQVLSLNREQAIILMNELLKRKYQMNDNFKKNFAKRLKKVVSFGSGASEECQRLETFFKDQKCMEKIEEDVINDLESASCELAKQIKVEIEPIETNFVDIRKLILSMFNIALHNSIVIWYYLKDFYRILNNYLKRQEKFTCFKYKASIEEMSQTDGEEKNLSYKNSPFVLPLHSSTVVLPSPFPVYSPSDELPEVEKPETNIFGLKADFPVDMELYSYLPCRMFRFSGLFHATDDDLLPLFNEVYGTSSAMFKCRLIRLESKIPCVAFIRSKKILLLSGAEIDKNGGLKLLKVTPQNYVTFIESVLLNEFGSYGMFCGRFVLQLNQEAFLHVRPTYFCCHQFSFEFFSASAGNFILEFYQQTPITPIDMLNLPKLEDLQEKWLNYNISTFDYLVAVNFFAQRSFTDLAAYPIFPRIIVDFRGEKADNVEQRDLSKPVQIVSQDEQTKKTFLSRFTAQKFYHSENVSNPMIVSSLHVRLIPFCRYQWFINEGWDAGDRNFLAIPFHLAIGPKTMYEITPEMFSIPEVLLNLNKFQLKNGTLFDIELPKWCKTPVEFIERHRTLLESRTVRTSINNWLDLIFGVKQNSKDDFNVFNPLSYTNTPSEDENVIKQQQNWTEMCGQVPKQVFQTEHQNTEIYTPLDYSRISFSLNPAFETEYRLSRGLCTLFHNNVGILTEPKLGTTMDICESEHKILFAVTLSISIVKVFLTINNKFKEFTSLRVPSPTRTVLCDSQFVAVTACDNELIFWSVSNGFVIRKVPFKFVKALTIDYPTSTVFAGSRNVIKHFTLSGTLIREFDIGKKITSILTFGLGYGIPDRVIAVGSNNGVVKIFFIDERSLETVLLREAKITRGPIVRIIYKKETNVLEVFDEKSNINRLLI